MKKKRKEGGGKRGRRRFENWKGEEEKTIRGGKKTKFEKKKPILGFEF